MNSSIKGSSAILISALFYGSYGIWSRLMMGTFGEFSQAWTRGLMLLVFIVVVGKLLRIFKPYRKQDAVWLIMIAVAGGINQAPYYYGFEHLSIGTATMLFYAALVVGGYIIGKLFLNEQLDKIKIASLILSIVGMLTIYRFSLSADQVIPAIATIVAGLLGSCTVALTKKVSNYYPEFQIMAGYFLVNVLVNGSIAYMVNDQVPAWTNSTAWVAQFAYATAMLLANFAAIEGFKYLEASVASLIGLAEILFGVLFGILFFNETLSLSIVIGAVIIIIAAALPNLSSLNILKKHEVKLST